MTDNRYDMAIIGGGIHGVGVAQAAAAAGYRTILLEERYLAAGTSSRSSKLIHGGLRYLETCRFALVREALNERRILLQNAPGLVRLLPFYLPVYRGQHRSTPKIYAALICYALLGGLHADTRFRFLPKSRWRSLDGLNQKGLVAVFQYQEAQTDDSLLTRAVMDSARSLGAELLCPAACIGMEDRSDHLIVKYREDTHDKKIAAAVVVNAAGPWLNHVLAGARPVVSLPAVDFVQGSHIVLEGGLEKGAYFVEHPLDRRMAFVMPWHGKTLVGTTETVFQGDPRQVRPLAGETLYLQQMVSRLFPGRSTAITKSFAGIRVLPRDNGALLRRSRETVLHQDAALSRCISIYGGKLTTYRATAQKVIRRAARLLPQRRRKADTETLPLLPQDSGNVLL